MLKGYKVSLRLLEQEDIGMLYKISNEENVRKFNIKHNNMQDNSEEINLRKAFSIINENDILIGFITYKEIYDKLIYSIGITIGSSYWGRGYGQDSIKTLLRYLFGELNAMKVELEVIKNNLRAINCYIKCGFVEGRIKKNNIYIDGEYMDIIIMEIFREDTNYN